MSRQSRCPERQPALLAFSVNHYNAAVICNHCIRGWAGDSGVIVRDSDLLSSPTMPSKCRACDNTQIYPVEFTIIESRL